MAQTDVELIEMAESLLDESIPILEQNARRLWAIHAILEKTSGKSEVEVAEIERFATAAESFSYLASRIVETKEEFELPRKSRFRFLRRR